MKIYLIIWSLIAVALPNTASAAITCTLNAPTALNFLFVPGTNSTAPANKIQSQVTAVCQRNLAGDPTTAVLALGSNDGLQPTGQTNQAIFSGNLIRYNLWRNVACSQPFRDGNNTRIEVNFASTSTSPVNVTFDYWACIPGQPTNSFPAGVYTDSVSLTLRLGTPNGVPLATASIPVSISVDAKCTISGGPSNITFAYSAFGPANFQFTGFSADCTNGLPYTMDVSQSAGVVGGLRYELGLSDVTGSATNIGPASLSRTGGATGSRAHVINGVMVANQAGALGAIVPQAHTLTITY